MNKIERLAVCAVASFIVVSFIMYAIIRIEMHTAFVNSISMYNFIYASIKYQEFVRFVDYAFLGAAICVLISILLGSKLVKMLDKVKG